MNLAEFKLDARNALPDALRVLLADYPRDAWASDPGFSDLVRFWLERHLMFRRLVDILSQEADEALSDAMEKRIYGSHLMRYGSLFMQELHAHHTVEDQHYFPRLRAMDDRLIKGFDLLDRDHHAIDAHLDGFAEDTNAVLATIRGEVDSRPAIEVFQKRLRSTRHLLDRHLTDEEDLIVPVILKYAPSGVV